MAPVDRALRSRERPVRRKRVAPNPGALAEPWGISDNAPRLVEPQSSRPFFELGAQRKSPARERWALICSPVVWSIRERGLPCKAPRSRIGAICAIIRELRRERRHRPISRSWCLCRGERSQYPQRSALSLLGPEYRHRPGFRQAKGLGFQPPATATATARRRQSLAFRRAPVREFPQCRFT